MKKIVLLIIIVFIVVVKVAWSMTIFSRRCPKKTNANKNSIIFVGKVNNLGNDKIVSVWFEFGENDNNLNKRTPIKRLNKAGLFCFRINKLQSCKSYYYRAVAKNQKGIAYGQIKEIKTKCE